MRILVAGIGNIFFGDDGFGVEVARRLGSVQGGDRTWPDEVRVEEYGIRGVHLAYELLDGYDVLVLIDAMPLGEAPGTVAIVEAEPPSIGHGTPMDAHSMSPATVLGLLAGLGGTVGRVMVVACEPAVIEEGIGLSPIVRAAVPAAVDAVHELLAELCASADV
jgi:hydrogenase maturation protease